MNDPREFDEQASDPQSDGAQQADQIAELQPRVDDADEVKGGRRLAEDPCAGGEISSHLG